MLNEDLDFLFSGPDAVEVTVGAFSFRGILNHSSEDISDGMFSADGHHLTVKTSDVKTLRERDPITVDGAEFRVRKSPRKIDDGLLSVVLVGAKDD